MAAGLVVVVVAAVLRLVLTGGAADRSYSSETHDRFIASCSADGGEPVRSACECLYEGIEDEVPYERFEQVDEELRDDAARGSTVTLPEDLDGIRAGCVSATRPSGS